MIARIRCLSVVVVVSGLLLGGCGGPPEEDRDAIRSEARRELYVLFDQAIREGRLGDREERLEFMEYAAWDVQRLPPEHDVAALPERFWTDDGMLVPFEELSGAQHRGLFGYFLDDRVANRIDGPRVRKLVRLARTGYHFTTDPDVEWG